MSDSLLGNVGKFVDGKAGSVMGGVGGQLSKWGSGIQASLAAAHHVGGLSVPQRLARHRPRRWPARPRCCPPPASPPRSLTHGLPSSPFAQGLMGALAGRGMSSMGSRVAAKVMPRSPAGG